MPGEGWGGQSKKRKKGCTKKGGIWILRYVRMLKKTVTVVCVCQHAANFKFIS